MSIREIAGGITAINGFTASGLSAGIKKNGRPDLALIVSRTPCQVAAVFTKNRCPASSITFNKAQLRTGMGRAIIANSGNANAATGIQGMKNTKQIGKTIAHALDIPLQSVYVASTGVIGEPLPMDKLQQAIPNLVAALSRKGSHAAAEAILTTDKRVKEVALVGPVGGSTVRIGGITKGSGMIHPNMATMLAFLTTDVAMESALLQEALKAVSDRTFNCITVDGETSTNDLVILFANGQAGKIRKKGAAYDQFVALLEAVCLRLAKQIVQDGEGATKLIEVSVGGAPRSNKMARQIAFSVARSSLVKTAFFGEDANWGRIVAAIGNAGAPVRMERLDILFGKTPLLRGGVYQGKQAEELASAHLKEKEVTLSIHLHSGPGTATVWSSDLSYDYVKINAAYRS
jgi:glutamate N-acetyltransferase/amino-acid N-acetyltransferase